MNHTKETLEKYDSEKQLFFDEAKGKIIKSCDIESYEDVSKVFPILRTSFEVGNDIPFEQAHVNPAIAVSLRAICAGAFPSKTSITGFQSFDGLPCKTPTQVSSHLKRTQDEIATRTIQPLIGIYEAAIKFLSGCNEKDFENPDILNLGKACQAFEEASQ
jgi:hypothetical protein|nr:MAG TPA: hypothetical protein [Caudoviricetes sp.]